jgi:hypothetical protein
VIESESKPSEVPVIWKVAVFFPNGKSPMLYVLGELTEKRPFFEVSVTETPDNVEYLPGLPLFSTTTETVLVSPTSIAEGIALSPSSMSRYW